MLKFLLDTNLCIRVLRDRPPSLRERFNREADGLAISTIILTELLHGAAKSARPEANRREVENFASRLEVLAYDAAAAHHAADIRATLERQGRSIGAYDVLIAGHARSRALIVVTGNRAEFGRVEGCAAKTGADPMEGKGPLSLSSGDTERRLPVAKRAEAGAPLLKRGGHAAFLISTTKPRDRIRLARFRAARCGFRGRR
jgi:tRNA(fMet)-specific endonuclease VapC